MGSAANTLVLSRRTLGPSPYWLGLLASSWVLTYFAAGPASLFAACLATAWTAVATAALVLSRERVALTAGLPHSARVGEPFAARLALSNGSRLLPLFAANVEATLVSSEGRFPLAPVPDCVVAPGSRRALRWKATIFKRGSYLPSVRIELRLPGALVGYHFDGVFQSVRPLWVVPGRYKLNFRSLETLASSRFDPGAALRVAAEATDEFVGLRPWRPGESMRRIHWKAYFRTGAVILKEFKDSAFGDVLVVLDTYLPKAAAASDERAALAAWRLERNVAFTSALAARLCSAGYRVLVKTAGPSPIDAALAPRQEDMRVLSMQLANLVPARRPSDVVELLKSQDNRKFGLTIMVSLGSKISTGRSADRRSIEIGPQRAVRYLAGRSGLKEAGQAGTDAFHAEELRLLRLESPAASPTKAAGASSWTLAAAGAAVLGAAILADRLSAPSWACVAGGAVGFGAAFVLLWQRQNDAFAGALEAAFVGPRVVTSRIDAPFAGALSSTLSEENTLRPIA